MNKEIKYNGLSAVPSDYECADGDLDNSLNLLTEKGAMSPVLSPKVLMTFDNGAMVIFIHKTISFTHYVISQTDGTLMWTESVNGELHVLRNNMHEQISHVNAIGNTLMIFTDTAIIYYLWKNNAYQELGDSLPDLQLSFGLVGHPRLYSVSDDSKSTFSISFNGISEGDLNGTFSEENKATITSQVMAKLNKFIVKETINKGRFCFPFFVRYALRLYDGTLTKHSAPILMNPSTSPAPIILWKRLKGRGSYTSAELDIMLMAASIDFRAWATNGYFDLIEDWSDIVKGVDVFISKPIYTYDQNGEFESFSDSDNFESKFIGRLYSESVNGSATVSEDNYLTPVANSDFLNYYAEYTYSQIYTLYFSPERKYPITTLHMPEFSAEKVGESLRNTSTFYKLCSLELSDIEKARSSRVDIAIEDEYLQSLVTREVMTDDYLSHDKLRASHSFVYNSRLNLSGVKRKLYDGFPLMSMLAFKNTDFNWSTDINTKRITISKSLLEEHNYTVTVYIREDGKDYAVTTSNATQIYPYQASIGRIFSYLTIYTNPVTEDTEETFEKRAWGCYFSYPNANAYKMVIRDSYGVSNGDGTYSYYRLVIDLKAHEFLNCAYALLDYDRVVSDNYDSSSIPSITFSIDDNGTSALALVDPGGQTDPSANINVVNASNKVYTSEVNNPFCFPVSGINTVGTGTILGICSAAKALSEGQFGQFPLYAFTTDGVWALEVSSTGTYSARQPITRDVCINSDSITQLDSAVLFVTDRGIMMLTGSQTACLTDTLNAVSYFDISTLPGLANLFPDKFVKIDCPFREFLKRARMTYDYVNQRILLYNPDKQYAYIYSMHSKLWGMATSRLLATVNSYPDALAMASGTEGTCLVDVSHTDDESARCLLVTRPFKLGVPDVFKTIDSIIQRGYFRKGHVRSILYGSRNLLSWHLVWSSKDHYLRGFRGTPYKYFRLALVCDLTPEETICSASLQFTPRLTNRPR